MCITDDRVYIIAGTHRVLVALYTDLVGIGGGMSDEDLQEMINAFMREACTEPMTGLGWLYFACGQRTLGALEEEDVDTDERNFNLIMVIFAINAIHGFPENMDGQEALFEKVHDAIQASIELGGPGIVEAALEDLEDILLNGTNAELAAQCRERGMPEEEIAATYRAAYACPDPLTSTLTSDHDIAVICIGGKAVATPLQFPIQFIQHNTGESGPPKAVRWHEGLGNGKGVSSWQ